MQHLLKDLYNRLKDPESDVEIIIRYLIIPYHILLFGVVFVYSSVHLYLVYNHYFLPIKDEYLVYHLPIIGTFLLVWVFFDHRLKIVSTRKYEDRFFLQGLTLGSIVLLLVNVQLVISEIGGRVVEIKQPENIFDGPPARFYRINEFSPDFNSIITDTSVYDYEKNDEKTIDLIHLSPLKDDHGTSYWYFSHYKKIFSTDQEEFVLRRAIYIWLDSCKEDYKNVKMKNEYSMLPNSYYRDKLVSEVQAYKAGISNNIVFLKKKKLDLSYNQVLIVVAGLFVWHLYLLNNNLNRDIYYRFLRKEVKFDLRSEIDFWLIFLKIQKKRN